MSQYRSEKQLLRVIGEQLARILELEERLSFAEERFTDLVEHGSVTRVKR